MVNVFTSSFLRRYVFKRKWRNRIILTTITLTIITYLIKHLKHVVTIAAYVEETVENKTSKHPLIIQETNRVSKGNYVLDSMNKVDWHNYELINQDLNRSGPGEQGEPARLPIDDLSIQDSLFSANGFNAALSDYISLNRSLPDFRHKDCRAKKYLESLPTVSVVVPFHNEHLNTLLRTVYSVINRSPPQLLQEIFLVDDASTKHFLKKKLDHIAVKIPKVNIIRLKRRKGLVSARMAGAKQATADAIVCLDAHTEATHNWLPPLLEPIALNYRTAVCPFIAVIHYDTLEYLIQDTGARGSFNWEFFYKRLPLLPKDKENMPEPFESPIMAGGLFAISRKFFWEIGGYDSGLEIWGGDQFELSFKIWMCGGRILDAPCSSVGHIYKKHSPFQNPGIGDYLGKNHRRVAEVWMDEYAQYLYNRRPYYVWIDPGDITEQIAWRKKLKCKSFRWFLTQIAFDLLVKFPPVDPNPYAQGQVRPLSHPHLCVDAHHGKDWDQLQLNPCVDIPRVEQKFVFGWLKDIKSQERNMCWDLPDWAPKSPVLLYGCHGEQRNQCWRYLPDRKQIIHVDSDECLAWEQSSRSLFIDICDETRVSQKWKVDMVNKEMMDAWDKNSLRVTGPVEKVNE